MIFVHSISNIQEVTYEFVGNFGFVGKTISHNILAIQNMMNQISF